MIDIQENDTNFVLSLGKRAIQIWKQEGLVVLSQRAMRRFGRAIIRARTTSVSGSAASTHGVLNSSSAPRLPETSLPFELAAFIGSTSFEDHYWTSGWQTANIQLITELRNSDDIIDIGCGVGRLAFGLYGWFPGRYVGVDIVPALIAYCKKQFPRFEFHHMDVQSPFFNPGGSVDPLQMEIPVESNSFDVAVLASVYTHLLPDAFARMTLEVSRVLKPNGRCFATFFILDNRMENSIYSFAHEWSAVCRVDKIEAPEAVVGYPRSFVVSTFAQYGLKEERFYRGNWAGQEGLGIQDEILFKKVAAEGTK